MRGHSVADTLELRDVDDVRTKPLALTVMNSLEVLPHPT